MPRPPRFRPGRGRPRQPGTRQPNRYPPQNGGQGNGGFPGGTHPGERYPDSGPMTERRPGPGYERGPDGPPANGAPWPRWATGGPAGSQGQRQDGQRPESQRPDGQRPDGRAPTGFGGRTPGYGGRPAGPGGRVPPAPGRQYLSANGRRIPPRADRLFRSPAPPDGYQAPVPPPGPRPGMPGVGTPGQGTPGYPGGVPGIRPQGYRGGAQTPPRPRFRPQQAPEAQLGGQVIKQRDNAVPERRPLSASQPLVAIAPDGLESFARDLRALRAKAELDLPEMAERSHYTMKTLASAAGGLRLPTLPVAIAYVRACDGDVAEWEDRWHKLAEKYPPAEPTEDSHNDGGDTSEPSDTPEAAAPQGATAPPPGPGEVFVITSAKPRQPGW